jgi:AraC-like DNA-binding protein
MFSPDPADERDPAPLALHERSYRGEPGLHRHAFYQLIFPHRGELQLRVEGRRVAVSPASWIMLPPGASHTYWADGPNHVLVADVAAPAMGPAAELPPAAAGLLCPRDGRLGALAALLQSELRAGALAEPLVAESLAAYVGAAVAVALRPRGQPAAPAGLADRARDYVEAHGLGPLTLEEVAAAAGASVAHLQRSFRAAHGVSVVEYVQALRVRRAAALLRDSDMPVEAVAAAVGFSSASYFSRLFARLTGASPGAFRRGAGRLSKAQSD